MTKTPPLSLGLDEAAAVAERLRARMRADVIGRDEVIELILVALLSDGHVLLEDYPGSGKTTLAKALGGALLDDEGPLPAFRRVQFTPDLLPSDITGVMIFDPEGADFQFRPGPIFAYVVLADEINRTTPKVQAAMLEAMAEKQVTVDNTTRPLDDLFFVIATQNPLDAVGTYPLPVAQLDRFLFKIKMQHIAREAELAVLDRWGLVAPPAAPLPGVARLELLAAREALRRGVHVAQSARACLVDLARALRADERCALGVSTRALVQAIPALQARAALRGRDFVSSEDIEALALPLFQHRLGLAPGVDDPAPVIADGLRHPLEALARAAAR
ncbi:AAA family ATPase [Myxococcota bacterium]|nr:AAA family ATPase [Myxococcota bacterium]MBU1433283.1 AAA family ATPase [Myxococcota bacterium]MBU1899007.1 AAA family ATPase [Myxococcota bacterium]